MSAAVILELSGVSKRFGSVQANHKVDLKIRRGTIHAVVGENGAGKSTLMKLAYGQIRADEGSIRIKEFSPALAKHSPQVAIAHGVGMVHQHFMLAGPMTVVENTVLGREPKLRGLLDLDRPSRELGNLSAQYGLDVDPHATVEELSVGQQQRVEILKVLWQGCDVLILDEPTAVLTPGEVRQLFAVLRRLVDGGATVVMITHKLDEVCAIADEITVMRRGEVVATLGGGASPEDIAKAMVGRPVLLSIDKGRALSGKTAVEIGDDVLVIDDLWVPGRGGLMAVTGCSLRVREGEIVGIAGVQGNGQSELFEAIAGLRQPSTGTISLGGADITNASVLRRFERGLAHVPEDRHARAVVLEFSIMENVALGRQHEFATPRGLDRTKMLATADAAVADFDVRPPDTNALMHDLSGGNQQKVVMARELGRPKAKMLLCGQPTRGVDVGAIELIHRRILAARDSGMAVLMISAELSELRGLADRVLVFYKGRAVAELAADELAAPDSLERMGRLMTGAASEESRGA